MTGRRMTARTTVAHSPLPSGRSRPRIGIRSRLTPSPRIARTAGRNVSDPMTATSTTAMVPTAIERKSGSSSRNRPAIEIITARPEKKTGQVKRAAVPIRQRILGSYGSDHSAVLVTESNHAGIADTITTKPTPTTPKQLVVPGSNPGSTMTLTGEQVNNAAIIIAEGRAAGIPEYGWVIGLAAALQESGIKMLDYGDRDSVNMFQQRPSSGWGNHAELSDPHLATRAFYGVADHTHNPGLTDIRGWQDMSVARAAQAVQRSAFPDAYAKWEPAARAIVERLAGITDPAATTAGPACTGGSRSNGVGACPATRQGPAPRTAKPSTLDVGKAGRSVRVVNAAASVWWSASVRGTSTGAGRAARPAA